MSKGLAVRRDCYDGEDRRPHPSPVTHRPRIDAGAVERNEHRDGDEGVVKAFDKPEDGERESDDSQDDEGKSAAEDQGQAAEHAGGEPDRPDLANR